MSNKDKELVTLICQDCGKSFTLSYGRYRRLPKDNHWRCRECNNIQRSLMFEKLSDEDKEKFRKSKSDVMKKIWTNMTVDEWNKRSKSQRERWAKLSLEEKHNIMKNTINAHNEFVKSDKFKQTMAEMNRRRWKAMSKKERQKEIERLNAIRDGYWNSLTAEEKVRKMQKMWLSQSQIGPTEFLFNTHLQQIGLVNGKDYMWGYSTYPYINPKYYDIFGKINKVTLEENFPYHTWDFILFYNSTNPWLIDIDGSAHDPKCMHFKRGNNTYTERQKIDYNDSQRIYQISPGMSAIVIEAYNDIIDDDTPIKNVFNNVKSTYSILFNIISNRSIQSLLDVKISS